MRVQQTDALAWMARCERGRYELVFIDPPFDAQIFDAALAAAAPLAVDDGWIYLEADRAVTPEAITSLGLRLHRRARAGAVHFHLLQRGAGI